MKKSSVKFVAFLIIATGMPAAANADTITGRFTYEHLQQVNITSPVTSGNVNTVKFNWTRQDSPGPGVDTMIDSTFNSVCIEPSQGISAGVNNIFSVMTPDAYGFAPLQVTMLQRLWADYYPGIDNADESAAFQMSVWEIVHDPSVDLGSGSFRVNSANPAVTLASSWLGAVSSVGYTRSSELPQIVVLQSASAQDQVTAVVPVPATAALAAVALAAMGVRRRRD